MNGETALQTIQSFKTLLSPEDYGEFVKGEDSAKLRAFPEVAEFLEKASSFKGEEEAKKKEEGETADGGATEDRAGKDNDFKGKGKEKKKDKEPDDDEDDKKPELKKALDDVELAKVALAAKEAELAKLQPAPEVEPVTTEMFKGLHDEINTKFSEVTKLISKSIGPSEEVKELKKSVDNMTALVEKIAGMPLGTKAIKAGVAANFFEKALAGESQDETGKKVLSVTANKDQVLKSLVDISKKMTDPELKKAYEDSIVRYNGGGGTIEKAVGLDLFENHDIRLVN
jgi:hypothetical protein